MSSQTDADWKITKSLEWCTHVPAEDQSQKSPTFFIQKIECYFVFCRKDTFAYNSPVNYFMYLRPKNKHDNDKLKRLPITIYTDYWGKNNFSKIQVLFSGSDTCLFYCPESTFEKKYLNLRDGFRIRFIFTFELSAEILLTLETKSEEKSTQADLMLTLQTDMDHLSLDFANLLKNGDHSDVQLLCNGGNIPAHRAILAARSKTFAAMFQENTEESISGLVNLTTTEKSIMEMCLEFLYKGKISSLPVEKAFNLYVLGDILKIPSLMKTCADLMISNTSEDNYISYLITADKYEDDHFKCGLANYISYNVALLRSQTWIKFSDEYPITAKEVLQKCILKLI